MMHILAGVALFSVTSLAALLLGQWLLSHLKESCSAGERLLFAWVSGILLIAYAIAIIAWSFGTGRWELLIPVALAALYGCRHIRGTAQALVELARGAGRALVRSRERAVYGLLAAFVLLSFLGALTPVDDRDWDGASEHLAQAKAYVRDGSFHPLWYDHHSEFPAVVQMLFTLALSWGTIAGAKLFHWAFGMAALAAAFLIARRHLHPRAGPWAALVLASTPAFSWLTGVAYVDLGEVAFGLLALAAVLRWRETQTGDWAAFAGLMAAGAMTVKMQGIPTFGVLALAMAVIAFRRRQIGHLLVYVGVAGVIACPWYIKSWVVTGNPVYPFAYSVFGGKQWSAEQAKAYDEHQLGFGVGKRPAEDELARMGPLAKRFVGPRAPLNLLLAPINLTFQPWAFTTNMGRIQSILFESTGPLYLALLPLFWLVGRRRRDDEGEPPGARRTATLVLGLFLVLWLWWLWSMQLGRYLLPSIALIVPVLGWLVVRCEDSRMLRGAVRATVWTWGLLGLLGLYLVTRGGLPVVFGAESERDHLTRDCAVYAPSQFINEAPQPGGVITYGEPRIFYLDRPAMWGDPGHHRLIDYANIKTPEQLAAAYRSLGLRYILINPQFFPDLFSGPDDLRRCLRQGLETGVFVELPFVRPNEPWPRRNDYLVLEVAGSK